MMLMVGNCLVGLKSNGLYFIVCLLSCLLDE
jgi:hypothetical protein